MNNDPNSESDSYEDPPEGEEWDFYTQADMDYEAQRVNNIED